MVSLVETVKPIHTMMRGYRAGKAEKLIDPTLTMTMLDVGGTCGMGGEWDALRSRFWSVVAVNLSPGPRGRKLANVREECGNGCNLPYANKSFDWVFSNATLEHVGNKTKQLQFCYEIRRIAKLGYFVSTPNASFPLDPHTYIPGYHWMRASWQKKVVRYAPGHMTEWQEQLRMVDRDEMQEFFPEATITTAGLGSNLIAFARYGR